MDDDLADDSDESVHDQEDQGDNAQAQFHESHPAPMMDEIAEADQMNVGNERDPADLLAMLADDAPMGNNSFRASTPLIPAAQSYIQQERARYGQQDHVNRVAQPHPQHFPQCRPGPVHHPAQNQAMNFNHVNINAAPYMAGGATARPQPQQSGERMRHRSEGAVRVPTKSAQSVMPPRTACHDRGSAADKPLSVDNSGQVPNSVLIDVIRMLASDRNQNNQQGAGASQPSTSNGVGIVQQQQIQQQQRAGTQATRPANFQQATPFPQGWQMVALPSRRLVAGVPTKTKPPGFCLAHYAVTQQTRLGKITEVNAQNCKDSSYLRLMQKLGLDLISVQNNIEVSLLKL